jgi:hypothetical protein
MNRFRKFLRLRLAEQVLLIRAVTLLSVIRIGLELLPFKMLKGLLSKLIKAAAVSSSKRDLLTERTVWAVQAATRYVPRATCLTQALATQVLLGFDGIPASVQIGVAKGTGGVLEAHAWLDADGRILLGGSDSNQKYARLLALDQKS